MAYDGPVIDAHHHFWDLELGRHPWLAENAPATSLGDISYLRQSYLPADYQRDIAGQNVIASVHVEALWDRARDPVEETAWLEGLDVPQGIAARCVAFADLASPRCEEWLEKQAAYRRVAGVRETIRWHPNPALKWAKEKLTEDPGWRRGVGLLAKHELLLELLMFPGQAQDVLGLAMAFPDQQIVLNHCTSPPDHDQEGMQRWRDGLKLVSSAPNISLKISNFPKYGKDKSPGSAAEIVLICLDNFGSERCLWGSDYPVGRASFRLDESIELAKNALQGVSDDEQAAIFFGNASRLYDII